MATRATHLCPQCGAAAAPDATRCPECGLVFKPAPPPPAGYEGVPDWADFPAQDGDQGQETSSAISMDDLQRFRASRTTTPPEGNEMDIPDWISDDDDDEGDSDFEFAFDSSDDADFGDLSFGDDDADDGGFGDFTFGDDDDEADESPDWMADAAEEAPPSSGKRASTGLTSWLDSGKLDDDSADKPAQKDDDLDLPAWMRSGDEEEQVGTGPLDFSYEFGTAEDDESGGFDFGTEDDDAGGFEFGTEDDGGELDSAAEGDDSGGFTFGSGADSSGFGFATEDDDDSGFDFGTEDDDSGGFDFGTEEDGGEFNSAAEGDDSGGFTFGSGADSSEFDFDTEDDDAGFDFGAEDDGDGGKFDFAAEDDDGGGFEFAAEDDDTGFDFGAEDDGGEFAFDDEDDGGGFTFDAEDDGEEETTPDWMADAAEEAPPSSGERVSSGLTSWLDSGKLDDDAADKPAQEEDDLDLPAWMRGTEEEEPIGTSALEFSYEFGETEDDSAGDFTFGTEDDDGGGFDFGTEDTGDEFDFSAEDDDGEFAFAAEDDGGEFAFADEDDDGGFDFGTEDTGDEFAFADEDDGGEFDFSAEDDGGEFTFGDEDDGGEFAFADEDEDAAGEDVPDWMADAAEEAQPTTGERVSTGLTSWLDSDKLPDAVDDTPLDEDDLDLPDWMADAAEEAQPSSGEHVSTGLTDWLNSDKLPGGDAPVSLGGDDDLDLPDWMQGSDDSLDSGLLDSGLLDDAPDWLSGGDLGLDETAEEPAGDIADELGLPDWIDEAGSTEDIVATPAPSSSTDDMLSGWISEIEVDESDTGIGESVADIYSSAADEITPVSEIFSGPDADSKIDLHEENSGPLAGMLGIVRAEPAIAPQGEPGASIIGIRATRVQQKMAAELGEVIKTEIEEVHPKKVRPRKIPVAYDRIITYALLALLTIIPFLSGSPLSGQPEAFTDWAGDDPAAKAYFTIEQLPTDRPVIIAVEYEPGNSGELDIAARAIMAQLARRGIPIVTVSTHSSGVGIAERLLAYTFPPPPEEETPEGEAPPAEQPPVEGEAPVEGEIPAEDEEDIPEPKIFDQYINLGYIPGSTVGISSFLQTPHFTARGGTFMAASNAAPWSEPILNTRIEPPDSTLPGLNQGRFGMLVILADTPDDMRIWLEQIQALNLNVDTEKLPVIAAVNAAAEPLAYPYYDKDSRGTLVGLVSGMSDSLRYIAQESTVNPTVDATNYSRIWDARWMGLLFSIAALAIGLGSGILTYLRERNQAAAPTASAVRPRKTPPRKPTASKKPAKEAAAKKPAAKKPAAKKAPAKKPDKKPAKKPAKSPAKPKAKTKKTSPRKSKQGKEK